MTLHLSLIYYNDGHEFPVHQDRLEITDGIITLARLANIATCITSDNIRAIVILPQLKRGLAVLEENPVSCMQVCAAYPRFLQFTRDYVAACEEFPNALVETVTYFQIGDFYSSQMHLNRLDWVHRAHYTKHRRD